MIFVLVFVSLAQTVWHIGITSVYCLPVRLLAHSSVGLHKQLTPVFGGPPCWFTGAVSIWDSLMVLGPWHRTLKQPAQMPIFVNNLNRKCPRVTSVIALQWKWGGGLGVAGQIFHSSSGKVFDIFLQIRVPLKACWTRLKSKVPCMALHNSSSKPMQPESARGKS